MCRFAFFLCLCLITKIKIRQRSCRKAGSKETSGFWWVLGQSPNVSLQRRDGCGNRRLVGLHGFERAGKEIVKRPAEHLRALREEETEDGALSLEEWLARQEGASAL